MIEWRVAQLHAADQDAAACRVMPTEQKSNLARFSRSRRAHNRDVRSGWNRQVDFMEHLMSRGDDGYVFERDRGCGFRLGCANRTGRPLFQSSQRLEQS